jgi:hypothetical protein
MTNATYLAQAAHFLGGYGVIMTVAAGFRTPFAVFLALILGTLLAALKEYWFDLRYETDPKQTLADSTLDFTFYLLGGAVGAASAFLTRLA